MHTRRAHVCMGYRDSHRHFSVVRFFFAILHTNAEMPVRLSSAARNRGVAHLVFHEQGMRVRTACTVSVEPNATSARLSSVILCHDADLAAHFGRAGRGGAGARSARPDSGVKSNSAPGPGPEPCSDYVYIS